MMTRAGTHSETIYGFSCTKSTTSATKSLLSVSDTRLKTMTREQLKLENFLEMLEKTKPEQNVQRKVKVAGCGGTQGGEGDYVFTHFEDLEKYIQRYRYYHTVCDTGQLGMDPRALGIEVDGYSSDVQSNKSSRSVSSVEPSLQDDFRNVVLKTRRSVSDMSTSSIRRNKSAPCSQNLKAPKRVYLTWEQYVEMCGADIAPHRSQFNLQTGGALLPNESEQTTVGAATRRQVSSAYSPSRDLRPVSFKATDNEATNSKHKGTGDQITAGSKPTGTESTVLSAAPSASSGVSLKKVTNKIPPKLSNVDKPKSCRMSGMKDQRGCQSVKEKTRRKITSLPEGHLEESISSMKLSDKHDQLKKVITYRCRNSRVSAVYRCTKKLPRRQLLDSTPVPLNIWLGLHEVAVAHVDPRSYIMSFAYGCGNAKINFETEPSIPVCKTILALRQS